MNSQIGLFFVNSRSGRQNGCSFHVITKTGWFNDVQDAIIDYPAEDEETKSDVLNITVASALLFVLFASGFLVFIYKFMSGWFMLVLVVLFSIGGVEVGSHLRLTCINKLISSKLPNYVNDLNRVCKHVLWLCFQGYLLLLFKSYLII